jgi:putative inorganic carbon (HCO3(-)) transporter
MQLNAQFRETAFSFATLIFAAFAAATIVLMAFLANSKIVFAIVGGLLFIMALIACGNIRLFCLWGLILSAPFALNISFMVTAHMGGAASIPLDAADVFLIPLIVFLLRDYASGSRPDIEVPRVLYWWLALALLGGTDIIFGPMREVALLEVFRMLKLSILFLVIVNEAVRVRQLEHIVAALMVGVAFQGAVSIAQYAFDVNFGAQILGEVTEAGTDFTSRATYQDGEFTNRVGGMIGHPNLLAIYMAMIMPIGLATLFSKAKPIYKAFLLVTVLLGAVTLILTLSRSGWIAFALAYILLMAVSFSHPSIRTKYVMGRLMSVVFIFLLAAALSGPILKRLTQSDSGAVSFRWEFMEVAMDMVLDKPVFGFGLNSFVWHMPPYTKYGSYNGVIDQFGDDLPVVHNIYLVVWSEQGTVGLLLFLAFNYHLMLIAWRGVKNYTHPFLTMVNLGCMAGMLALLADGMASFFIRNPNCGRVYFMIVALTVAIDLWHRHNAQGQYKPRSVN